MRLREGTRHHSVFGLILEAVKIYSEMLTLQGAGTSDRVET